MKLTLKKPVKLGEHGDMITELTFREDICGGDLRGIKLANLTADMRSDDLLLIAQRLSGQPEMLFLKLLSQRDVFNVLETVGGFYSAGLETGTAG